MNLDFEDSYKISMTCLRMNGAHPAVARDYKWALQFTLMHGYYLFISTIAVGNIIFVDIKTNDFPNACTHGISLVLFIVVSFNYCVLLWYQSQLKTMISLQQDYFNSVRTLPPEDQEVVYQYVGKGQWVTKLWLVSTLVTMVMFPIKGIIYSAYSAYKGNFTLYPFSENVYPSSIDAIKNRIDVFIIIYIMHLLYAFYAVLMYTGFTPLGPIFILNTSARVEIVKNKVDHFFDARELSSEETTRKMRKVILDLQEIYSFVEQINEVFQVLYEITLKSSAIMMPITIFVLIETFKSGELSIDYIMFAYAGSLFSFMPCFYSDVLMEKGDELRAAIYSCGWENFYDRGTRATILIMLTRTIRPISIQTVFRIVCLDAFAELCHQAYALFSLMNAAL